MDITSYQNKYFSILGDSISTLAGYNPDDCAVFYDWTNKQLSGVYAPEDTWWGKVIHTLGGHLLVNHSWSGSLVCKHPDCEIESYGCSDARTAALATPCNTPDVVMILLGLNDFGWGMRPMPAAGEQDLAVFSVAYDRMLEKLRQNYPRAELWCLTLPHSCWSKHPEVQIPLVRAGWHQMDYCRVIRSCGEQWGCRVVDIFSLDVPYDTIDGYHPNARGMQTLAEAVLGEVERWCGHDH